MIVLWNNSYCCRWSSVVVVVVADGDGGGDFVVDNCCYWCYCYSCNMSFYNDGTILRKENTDKSHQNYSRGFKRKIKREKEIEKTNKRKKKIKDKVKNRKQKRSQTELTCNQIFFIFLIKVKIFFLIYVDFFFKRILLLKETLYINI